jgi:hypothetical protein
MLAGDQIRIFGLVLFFLPFLAFFVFKPNVAKLIYPTILASIAYIRAETSSEN